jgi:glycosyl transferase family 17
MRRIWDTFPFFNELDLLEARLIELDPVIYRYVLVESPVTHQGYPKPLYFAENKERFAPWQDKIIHIIADLGDQPPGIDPIIAATREVTQRAAVLRGLDEMKDDDIFLVSDVDEIPHADVLCDIARGWTTDQDSSLGYSLAMRNHTLAVNLLEPGWWIGTLLTSGGMSKVMKTVHAFYYRQVKPTLGVIRDEGGWPLIAGSHFSWIGGPDTMRVKAHSFMHPKMVHVVDEHAERMYRDKVSPVSSGQHLIEVVIDETWPQYMQDRRGPPSWYWPGHAV